MNKEDEVNLLTATVKLLGEDSYTGPWLAEQLPELASAIRSDLPAECQALSLAEARAEAARIIADARHRAGLIDEEAAQRKAAANAELAKVRDSADELRRRVEDARQTLRQIFIA